jgi:hypothetical protein
MMILLLLGAPSLSSRNLGESTVSYVYIDVYIWMYIFMYMFMHIFMYMYMYIHKLYYYTTIHLCRHMCTYINTYIFTYILIHMYSHIYLLRGMFSRDLFNRSGQRIGGHEIRCPMKISLYTY